MSYRSNDPWAQRSARSLLVLLAGCAAGCEAGEPDIGPKPSDRADAGASTFVDLVISYTENDAPFACSRAISPICQEQTGPCAGHALLGAPDSVTYQLPSNGSLEVGFLCDPILDRAEGSDLHHDFRLHATFTTGSRALVSVSEDGTDYIELDTMLADNQSFDLSTRGLKFARFVRVVAGSDSALSVDAIEALP